MVPLGKWRLAFLGEREGAVEMDDHVIGGERTSVERRFVMPTSGRVEMEDDGLCIRLFPARGKVADEGSVTAAIPVEEARVRAAKDLDDCR